MSERFEQLAKSSDAELEALLRGASAPEEESLAGFEWRGWNTPAFTALLGIRQFVKGFFRGAEGLEGYNIPVRQSGLIGPWKHKPDSEHPKRFGFYRVLGSDARYPKSVLLDYGASPRNFALAPERVLRDYLAQPFAGKPDVLLGKAYLALGFGRVFSNFFVLERLRETKWTP